jgi:hypothetical protein
MNVASQLPLLWSKTAVEAAVSAAKEEMQATSLPLQK